MDIIKKAYKVWHEGMLSDNPHEGYTIDDLPVVYADSPSKAKSIAKEPFDWTLEDEEPKYTDLKVRRASGKDILEFEGTERERWIIEMIKNQRERIEKRKKAVERFSDDTLFYIQNGYVGNSVLWWGKNSNGYTTNINKAGLYTKEEVLKKFVNSREEDVIWESSHVDNNIVKQVDGQYLNREYSV